MAACWAEPLMQGYHPVSYTSMVADVASHSCPVCPLMGQTESSFQSSDLRLIISVTNNFSIYLHKAENIFLSVSDTV